MANIVFRPKGDELQHKARQLCALPDGISKLVHMTSPFNAIEWIKSSNSPLTKEEIEITETHTARELRDAMARGERSAEAVTSAFMRRAALAEQLVNWASEIFFDVGLERARELDAEFHRTGKPVGCLHGLPISVKDCFLVQGQYSTLGLKAYLSHDRDTKNSPLVDILLKEGAVLYAKTNVSQTMMAVETDNAVIGRTLNPHNLGLTAGGSSGGEGALIASGGSIAGMGTDIGGSVRIPAICCGVYGFKPTVGRFPYGEVKSCSRGGTPGILPAAGPMAQTADDLALLCESVMASKHPWKNDAEARGTGWRNVQPKALRIGVWMGEEEGKYALTAPIIRALKAAAESLRNTEHAVIVLRSFPSVSEAVTLAADFFQLDDQDTLKHVLHQGKEEPIPALANTALESVTGPKRADVWDCNRRLTMYRAAIAKLWCQHRLDVLICPPSTTVATSHDQFPMPAYTVPWNLVDFPASVIPYWEKKDRANCSNGNSQITETPSGIQVVAYRDHDELLLMATVEIDKACNSYDPSV